MPVSDGVKNQSEVYVRQAGLHETGRKRLIAADAEGDPLVPVLVKGSQTCAGIADPRSLDLEQLETEDKLGCARGVLWSLLFEAVLAAGAVLYWKFHFFSH